MGLGTGNRQQGKHASHFPIPRSRLYYHLNSTRLTAMVAMPITRP